jgi:hypothetical protein
MEVGFFESSVQSIVTQMTLVRAVMTAINDGDAEGAEKQLRVLADEVFNQKYIMMNENVTELLVILNEFRRH